MKATLHATVDFDTLKDAETVLEALGLTPNDAIDLLMRQIALRGGLPFSIRLPRPNAQTRQTFADTDAGRNLTEHADADAMFRHLGVLNP